MAAPNSTAAPEAQQLAERLREAGWLLEYAGASNSFAVVITRSAIDPRVTRHDKRGLMEGVPSGTVFMFQHDCGFDLFPLVAPQGDPTAMATENLVTVAAFILEFDGRRQ